MTMITLYPTTCAEVQRRLVRGSAVRPFLSAKYNRHCPARSRSITRPKWATSLLSLSVGR